MNQPPLWIAMHSIAMHTAACLVVVASLFIGVIAAAEGDPAPASSFSFTPWTIANPRPNLGRIKSAGIEKPVLKFGMIKLTDCVPLVAARELGFFAEEGLSVAIEVQANWKNVQDRVISGELDGSHMLYNHPLGVGIGYLGKAELIAPFNISINGKGITASLAVWTAMQAHDPTLTKAPHPLPVKADALKPVAAARAAAGNPLRLGMTFPSGSHNMTLRYWLAAGGINPGFYTGLDDPVGQKGADVLLSVVPPPQMKDNLEKGTIDLFCVGEPWNQQVVRSGTGVAVNGDQYVFDGCPDKIFGCRADFATRYPNTLRAVIKALIRANQWLDDATANRLRACEMLAHSSYIGANVEVLAESMTGTYCYASKDDRRVARDFNIFHRRFASFPFKSHAVWGLTQARRWGQIPESKPDAWYLEMADKIFRCDLYRDAFAALVAEGKAKAEDLPADDWQAHPAEAFIDRIAFDPKQPNAYLARFAIGLK